MYLVHGGVLYVGDGGSLRIYYIHTYIYNVKARKQPKSLFVHKSRGEVSLVEQDTIEFVTVTYLEFRIIFLRKSLHFYHLHFMQRYSANVTILKNDLKKYFLSINIVLKNS